MRAVPLAHSAIKERHHARTVWPVGAGLLSMLLLVAGCGSSSSSGDDAASGPWSFTDGSGKTVELDKRPPRIIAHAYSAAALMEFGIKPIAVYADGPIKDDVGLQNVDFEGIEVIGETWGKIDVEKAAALKPDLIVADYWPVEKDYSGMEDGVEAKSKKIAELAPVVGPAQGDSIVELIEGYAKLAETLGRRRRRAARRRRPRPTSRPRATPSARPRRRRRA